MRCRYNAHPFDGVTNRQTVLDWKRDNGYFVECDTTFERMRLAVSGRC